MEKATDEDLVKRAKSGDQLAFSELIRRLAPAVFGYTVTLFGGDMHLAEDVSQNCWLNVAKNLDNYCERGKFKAWVMTIARNAAFTEMKKNKRFVLDETINETAAAQDDIEMSFMAHAEKLLLQKAVDSLPDVQRFCLTMWLQEEASVKEIAESLQIAEGSAKLHLYRAKKTVKEILHEQG